MIIEFMFPRSQRVEVEAEANAKIKVEVEVEVEVFYVFSAPPRTPL